MFGMSFLEIAVILVLILVVFGPEKIPEVARTAGKVMREVRKASNLLRDALEVEEDRQQRRSAITQKATPALASAARPSMDELEGMGPLDQLDEDQMGLDSASHFAAGWHEPERVEVPMAARLAEGSGEAIEVALMPPRLDPMLAHAEQERVALHDQLIEEWHR